MVPLLSIEVGGGSSRLILTIKYILEAESFKLPVYNMT